MTLDLLQGSGHYKSGTSWCQSYGLIKDGYHDGTNKLEVVVIGPVDNGIFKKCRDLPVNFE